MKRYAISKNGRYAVTQISLRISDRDDQAVYMAVEVGLIGQMVFGKISRQEAARILNSARIERLKIKKTE